jgi:hypothetical protein
MAATLQRHFRAPGPVILARTDDVAVIRSDSPTEVQARERSFVKNGYASRTTNAARNSPNAAHVAPVRNQLIAK